MLLLLKNARICVGTRISEHMNNHHADVLEAIRSTGKLETETENALKAALDELVAEFQA